MARVSTRTARSGSKQNYGTPDALIAEAVRRYGRPILFDLAAEPANKKNARYFAAPKLLVPPQHVVGETWIVCKVCEGKMFYGDGEGGLGFRHEDKLSCERRAYGKEKLDCDLEDDEKIWIPNTDPEAYALDALAQEWHKIPDIAGGLLWLNPPFASIEAWVVKCKEEGQLLPPNTSILFLVPAAVGSVWFLENVAKIGDRNYLKPRVPFNGEPYNKDCMIVEFHREMNGLCFVWDWKKGLVIEI